VQLLLAGFKYLTVWADFTDDQPAPELVGRAAGFFPFVGLLLGLLLALSNYVLSPYLNPEILSVVVIALLIAATGARHLHGVKETFDELGAKAAGRDGRRNEALGFAAIVLVILFKIAAADSMDEILSLSLLLTPVLARWAVLIFIYGYDARFDETLRLISARVKFSSVLTSTAATLALTVYFLGRKGLWIALIVSLIALLLRGLLHRRHGIVSQANIGAIVELAEALSLVLLASL
jgi:adenosylcobinamide-GDP ribazoletransferase